MKKAASKKRSVPSDSFESVVKAFAGARGVTFGGKGFGSTALKVDGKIFAMVSSNGEFVVKLPKERVAELVKLGRGAYFDAGKGKKMKEWLTVTTPPKSWVGLAKEAHRFVSAPPLRRGNPG